MSKLEALQKKLHRQLKEARTQIDAGKTSQALATYFNIATEMILSGEISTAMATYKLILKEEPDNPMALTFLSNLYQHQGLEAEVQQLNSQKNGTVLAGEDFSNNSIELSRIEDLERVISPVKVDKNHKIISQNLENHNLYLITEGRFQVLRHEPGESDKVIATLNKGNLFGELTMLLPHRKASATVIALESGKLLTVARDQFKQFLETRPALLETILTMAHKRLLEYALKPLLFSEGDEKQLWLSRLTEEFKVIGFAEQETLISEGEKKQSLYVVLDGALEVSCKGSQTSVDIPITTLKAGDFFGEFSLLTGEPASASIKALSSGWVAILEKEKVDHLATHFPEFLPRILSSFRTRKQSLLKKKIGSLENQSTLNSEPIRAT